MGRRKILILSFLAVGVVATSFGTLLWMKAHQNPFPANIRKTAPTPLYYPSKLPGNMELKKNSINATSAVVAFIIKDGRSQLYVAEQPRSDNFDYDQFNHKQLDKSYIFLTKNGEAAIGQFNNQTVGSLVTDKTWILITGPPNYSNSNIEQIFLQLKPVP